jgi:hypothetical protein
MTGGSPIGTPECDSPTLSADGATGVWGNVAARIPADTPLAPRIVGDLPGRVGSSTPHAVESCPTPNWSCPKIDGIAGLRLPPRAVNALALLKQPAADGLLNLVHGGVTTFVQSDAFVDVWTGAVRDVHRALTNVATPNGSGVVVVLTGDGRREGQNPAHAADQR